MIPGFIEVTLTGYSENMQGERKPISGPAMYFPINAIAFRNQMVIFHGEGHQVAETAPEIADKIKAAMVDPNRQVITVENQSSVDGPVVMPTYRLDEDT